MPPQGQGNPLISISTYCEIHKSFVEQDEMEVTVSWSCLMVEGSLSWDSSDLPAVYLRFSIPSGRGEVNERRKKK